MIYLDYAATTPIDNEVLNTYVKVETTFFANTTSIHTLGQESNYMFEKAINEIKKELNIKHNIVFTANATEANNLAILGITKNKKGRVITSVVEHPSVYNVFKNLEKEGYDVCYLKVNQKGEIDIDNLKSLLTKDTLLVSIMWVNNVTGTVEPIKEVIEALKEYPKAKLHVDISQGICKETPDFDFNKVDLMSLSTHKIYGPKGVGALLCKQNINLEKLTYGSKNQYEIKPGTVSVALAAATTKAIKKFFPLTITNYEYVKKLNSILRDKLSLIEEIKINSPENANPYILSISIPKIKSETFVHVLEREQIYVSNGTSCSSKYETVDRVIKEMTNNDVLATTAIRISLSHLTKEEEIYKLIDAVERGIKCTI